MARPKRCPRDPDEPSYGKIMTSMLIPKNPRSNPRRMVSGIAFVAFLAFFVFAAMGRGCTHATQPQNAPPAATSTPSGS
ncbi:MAG: hypothetical protein V3571_05265 [Pseudodesulfovibrio sp.]